MKIGLIGSTGSIGKNALEVIKNLRKNGKEIDIFFLTANSRIDLLAEQVNEFKPQSVFIHNSDKRKEFEIKYNFKNLRIIKSDEEFYDELKSDEYEMLISALVGISGLAPTIEAIKAGKKIALANKETLVVAGSIVNEYLRKHKTELIPIDSEHSAILQCLMGENDENISKIILTASGGPFRNKSIEEIKRTSVEDALNHPNWNMGNKITIDSATLVNKGLEVIEAKWLFNLTVKQIEIIIHPQSIIHSLVEFKDGSVKAQLGIPDMKIPIQFAITYPGRVESDFTRLDFNNLQNLTFEKPDFEKFKCLKLAFDVIERRCTYPTVLNAANEVSVELFLNKKIGFFDIPEIIEESLDIHNSISNFDLEDVYRIDKEVREKILSTI